MDVNSASSKDVNCKLKEYIGKVYLLTYYRLAEFIPLIAILMMTMSIGTSSSQANP